MLNKLKKENIQFANEWKKVREKGFFRYVLSRIISLGIMMFLIFIIEFLIADKNNYVGVAIIYAAVVFVMSILSWVVNEFRYKRSERN